MITCIVIDDDINTTNVFSDLLEMMGLDVLAKGHDGYDAISLYMKHCPDIVFTDIMMPNADGFYGIQKIKEFDPHAKIVAVTADVSAETQNRLENMDITVVICKPFDQNEIKQVLLEKYQININNKTRF